MFLMTCLCNWETCYVNNPLDERSDDSVQSSVMTSSWCLSKNIESQFESFSTSMKGFDEHDHTLSQIPLRPAMQTELLHSTGQQHDQYILICDADHSLRNFYLNVSGRACHDPGRYFVMQDWLVNSGADVHVMDKLSWIRMRSG